jgi:hypothetical protein
MTTLAVTQATKHVVISSESRVSRVDESDDSIAKRLQLSGIFIGISQEASALVSVQGRDVAKTQHKARVTRRPLTCWSLALAAPPTAISHCRAPP